MQNTELDIKKILKRESSFIISDMIKNNRISLSGYFNELSASLIYLNYSDPDFRERNNISKCIFAITKRYSRFKLWRSIYFN